MKRDTVPTNIKMNKTQPNKIPMGPGAVTIKEATSNSGILLKERKRLNNPNLWHRITVYNCDHYPRDYVLKTIIDDLEPLDFIPMYYFVEGQHASFFVRNCRMAIEKLCRQNFIVINPQEKNKPFKLSITLAYSNTAELSANVQDNVMQVLHKRYNISSKTLNLDNFVKDPDLTEYCTFSQPKILYFVLHLSKQFQLHALKLSNNDIKLLTPIESVWGSKNLTVLDLRNNLIDNMAELNILKAMQITELMLDGNPVCESYDEYSYVQAVKEVCPKIEKLDGVLLGQNGFLAFRRNFLISLSGQDLVDQFLEHYFSLYDTTHRSCLEGLYSKDALFSVTCRYLPGQLSTSTASLGAYKSISRNLRLLSDLARSEEYLYKGSTSIVNILVRLPLTEHDPYTFTVDLIHYDETAAILTVTGVFREPAQTLLDTERVLGFSRTFVLKAASNNEYNIVNEQLQVSNATTAQQQRAFKIVRVPKASYLSITPAQSEKEKAEMVEALKALTHLNIDWAIKCLEDCGYDLKNALTLFVDLYKLNKIPDEAFTN